MVPIIVKNVVRILLYDPPFNQSNYEEASPYQLPSDNDVYHLRSLDTLL